MATKITGQVLGGTAKVIDEVETVRDVLAKLGISGSYTATVNGNPADMDDEVEDYNFVSFSPAVKGGC